MFADSFEGSVVYPPEHDAMDRYARDVSEAFEQGASFRKA
jgi:hypothetical protein